MNEEPGIDPKTDIPEPDPNYDKAFAESIAEESSEIRSSMEQDPRFKLIALSKTVSRIRYGLGSISFVGGVALIFLTLYHANVGLQEAIKLIVDNGLGETVPWVLVAKAFVYATSLTMASN